MNKNYLYIVIVAIVVLVVIWFLNNSRSSNQQKNIEQNQQNVNIQPEKVSNNNGDSMTTPQKCERVFTDQVLKQTTVSASDKFITMSVAGFGDIKIELNRKDAPKTSENFLKLAKAGFYDCLTFHRVSKQFVVQGGDPEGTGIGGPGYTIPAEIGLLHKKGSVAMARQADSVNPKKESSGSQFYFALEDLPMLDGQYTVFAQVVSGMDVVDKIGQVPLVAGTDGPPKETIIINQVAVSAD